MVRVAALMGTADNDIRFPAGYVGICLIEIEIVADQEHVTHPLDVEIVGLSPFSGVFIVHAFLLPFTGGKMFFEVFAKDGSVPAENEDRVAGHIP